MKIKFIVDKYDERYNQIGDKTPPKVFISDPKDAWIPIQGEPFDIGFTV